MTSRHRGGRRDGRRSARRSAAHASSARARPPCAARHRRRARVRRRPASASAGNAPVSTPSGSDTRAGAGADGRRGHLDPAPPVRREHLVVIALAGRDRAGRDDRDAREELARDPRVGARACRARAGRGVRERAHVGGTRTRLPRPRRDDAHHLVDPAPAAHDEIATERLQRARRRSASDSSRKPVRFGALNRLVEDRVVEHEQRDDGLGVVHAACERRMIGDAEITGEDDDRGAHAPGR